jgi:CRP/FNR family transcriptional regulator, cyclic AMP receptor protein
VSSRRVEKVWVVLDGAISCSMLSAEGESITVAALGEGSYFGTAALAGDAFTPLQASAIGRTEVAILDLAALKPLLGANEEGKHLIGTILHRRMLATISLYRDAVSAPLLERIVRRLLNQALAAGRSEAGEPIELHLSQEDLASMVGAARSKVSAELKALEHEGMIRLGYRTVVVVDIAKLLALAGTDIFPL